MKSEFYFSPQSGGWIDVIGVVDEWVLFLSPQWRTDWYYWSRWTESFVSLPRVEDGLILSEWMKHEYCLSVLRVAEGLILSEWMKHEFCFSPQSGRWIDIIGVEEAWVLSVSPTSVEDGVISKYIRVSFVSLPRVADGLILSEWMKHEYCLSLPRAEDEVILSSGWSMSIVCLSPEWRMDWYYRSIHKSEFCFSPQSGG